MAQPVKVLATHVLWPATNLQNPRKSRRKEPIHQVVLSSDPSHMGCGTRSHIYDSSFLSRRGQGLLCDGGAEILLEFRLCTVSWVWVYGTGPWQAGHLGLFPAPQ